MEIRPAVSTPHPATLGLDREPASAAAAPPAALFTPDPQAGSQPADAGDADVQRAVERINDSLPPSSQGIEFSVDADSDRVIVKVVDRETREVLRQMPSKEALEIAKALDRTQGLLIKSEA